MNLRFAAPLLLALAVTSSTARAQTAEPTRIYSRPLAGLGGLLVGMGGFGLLVATPFTVSAMTCSPCGEHDVNLWPMMVAGGVAVAIGIPLLVIGLHRVPDTVAIGPAGVGFRF